MSMDFGYVPTSSVLYFYFCSYNAAGASVTITGLATSDILIYKAGSTTQRSSTSGFTLLDTDGIDFDSVTGIHGFSVDTSDNTDAGFYAAGSQYTVFVSVVTIDSQTVTLRAGSFLLGPAQVDVRQFNGTAGTFASGRPETNTTHIAGSAVSTSSAQIGVNVIQAAGTAWNSGAIGASTLATDTITAAKIAADAIGASELAADAVTEIQAAVAAGAVASVTGAVGSVTGNVGGNVTGSVGSVVGAVGSVTGNLGGNVTGSVGSVVGAVGSVTGAVGSVTGAVGSVTGNVGGNVTGSVGSLAAQAKADVNAEVLDVLNVDTFAEQGQGNAPATATLRQMLAYLYKAWRNRSVTTATAYKLYSDDAVTVDQKAALTVDTSTVDRGEVATGP